jgi:hypothetical protein
MQDAQPSEKEKAKEEFPWRRQGDSRGINT